MSRAAILSFCPDLTDPSAVSTPLFRVSVLPGARLNFSYLLTYDEMRRLVGRDNTTMGIVQFYPWTLTALLGEVGEAAFLNALASTTQHSSIYVERFEPC